MADVRRILIIFVIAVLFTIFINVSIDAFYPRPDYEDYCGRGMIDPFLYKEQRNIECPGFNASQELIDSCNDQKGMVNYRYDSNGCVTDAYCETCQINYDAANEKYNFIVFIVSAIAGIIAIILGLQLPIKNPINEWIGSGFLLGGIITIFVGTARYFGNMGRYARPFVILFELILVIWLTYKKLGKK